MKVLYSKEKPISAEGRTTEEEKGMRRTISGKCFVCSACCGLADRRRSNPQFDTGRVDLQRKQEE